MTNNSQDPTLDRQAVPSSMFAWTVGRWTLGVEVSVCRVLLVTIVLSLLMPISVLAQLAPPNKAGVSMGHLHYQVRDVEANKRFWIALGGTPDTVGDVVVVKFPDVLVFLAQ